jgi:nucleotide-binding universal stress UspA family protein
MIKRILVGLSDKPSTTVATQRAINLARLHGAEIAGMTVVNTAALESVGPTPLGAANQARQLREHRREVTIEHVEEAVQQFARQCSEAGITHEIFREEGKPLERMIQLSRYYDLVILNLHELFDYGVAAEPDETVLKLIHAGVRPILACAPAHGDIRKILVAYNGSIEAAKAMRRLIHLRVWPHAEFKLICFELARAEASALLEDAARFCRAHGVTPEVEYAQGSPRQGLLEAARAWGADLIAIGASTRHRLLHRIVGDVPHTLIKTSDRHLFLAQ